MKISLLIVTILLCFLANLSAQDNYSISNDIELNTLSNLLDWDESKVEYKSTPSVDTTQTSSCIYYHKNEILEVNLIENNGIGIFDVDSYDLKIADGSFNEEKDEITFEYNERRGYYIINIKFTTKRYYKGIEELLNEISNLLNLKRKVEEQTNVKYYYDY